MCSQTFSAGTMFIKLLDMFVMKKRKSDDARVNR